MLPYIKHFCLDLAIQLHSEGLLLNNSLTELATEFYTFVCGSVEMSHAQDSLNKAVVASRRELFYSEKASLESLLGKAKEIYAFMNERDETI